MSLTNKDRIEDVCRYLLAKSDDSQIKELAALVLNDVTYFTTIMTMVSLFMAAVPDFKREFNDQALISTLAVMSMNLRDN